MERPTATSSLAALDAPDLAALRLAAQVMAHRAQLAGRPAVVLYFDSLEASVLAEEAARSQRERPAGAPGSAVLDATAGAADRRLIAEYLGLIAANERLPAAVRGVCGALRARYGE